MSHTTVKELADLGFIVHGEPLRLSVEELASFSCETPTGLVVIAAETPRF
jgi:hypothetical protein